MHITIKGRTAAGEHPNKTIANLVEQLDASELGVVSINRKEDEIQFVARHEIDSFVGLCPHCEFNYYFKDYPLMEGCEVISHDFSMDACRNRD